MSPRAEKPSLPLACFAVAVQGLTFTNHAPLLPMIIGDLRISPGEAGLLSTAMFLSGGLLAFPIGTATDRFGAKRVMTFNMALLTIVTAALGVAPSFAAMLVLKVFSGVGVTGSFVAGGHYVNALWEGRRRSFAQGIFGGSIQLGAGAAIFGVPLVAAPFGWRAALSATAIPLAVATALWAARAQSVASERRHEQTSSVFADPTIWRLGLANTSLFGLSIVFGTWVSVYLVHDFGLRLEVAAALGSCALLFNVIGRPLGGFLILRGSIRPKRAIVATLAGSALALVVMAWPGRPLALTLVGIVTIGMMNSLSYAAIITITSHAAPAAMGAALGLVAMLSTVSVVVGAPLIGALFAAAGNFTVPWLVLAALPVGVALTCLRLPPD